MLQLERTMCKCTRSFEKETMAVDYLSNYHRIFVTLKKVCTTFICISDKILHLKVQIARAMAVWHVNAQSLVWVHSKIYIFFGVDKSLFSP